MDERRKAEGLPEWVGITSPSRSEWDKKVEEG